MTNSLENNPQQNLSRAKSVFVFFVMVIAVLLLRSYWTYPIEHGDAVQKYNVAAKIVSTGNWELMLRNHHTSRWASVLPQTFLTWLVGPRYELFYALPLLLFSLYFSAILLTVRKYLGFGMTFFLATLMFCELLGMRSSNQLLNPPFAILFGFMGMYLLAAGGITRKHAILAGLCFFVAYGAHVTYLSFAAGAGLWLLLFKRDLRALWTMSVTLMALFLLESFVFGYLSNWELSYGRIELLASGKHVDKVTSGVFLKTSWSQLTLGRWTGLSYLGMVSGIGFLAGMIMVIFSDDIRSRTPALVKCILITLPLFVLSVSLSVVSLDPLRPLLPVRPMYLEPFIPFGLVVTVFALREILGRIKAGIIGPAGILLSIPVLIAFHDVRIKPVGMVWSAEREYSAFSELAHTGKLIFTGQRQGVFAMIATFQEPAKKKVSGEYTLISKPLPEAQCVERLRRYPLHKNYFDCEPDFDK